jgi:hypothetical protein
MTERADVEIHSLYMTPNLPPSPSDLRTQFLDLIRRDLPVPLASAG